MSFRAEGPATIGTLDYTGSAISVVAQVWCPRRKPTIHLHNCNSCTIAQSHILTLVRPSTQRKLNRILATAYIPYCMFGKLKVCSGFDHSEHTVYKICLNDSSYFRSLFLASA